MSISVEVSEVIERPVEEVFRIHATEHVQNHPRWDPYMQLEQLTEGPLGVGTMIKRINSHSAASFSITRPSFQRLHHSFVPYKPASRALMIASARSATWSLLRMFET
jgi:hypothetical protein